MKFSRAFDGIKKVSNINTYQVNCKQDKNKFLKIFKFLIKICIVN